MAIFVVSREGMGGPRVAFGLGLFPGEASPCARMAQPMTAIMNRPAGLGRPPLLLELQRADAVQGGV